MTYTVTVFAQSRATATIKGIEARSHEEAKEKALQLAQGGEAIWKMDGIDPDQISVGLVSREAVKAKREYESPVDML